jgi:hypothetical protein
MALVSCPTCGSDDITKAADSGGSIQLRCLACGLEFSREPRIVCRRCGSDDIEFGFVADGWAYDDDDPDVPAASRDWSHYEREPCRCRKCNNRWRISSEPVPHKRPQ